MEQRTINNMEWNDCSDIDQECAAWSFQDKDHNGGQSFARFRIEVAAYQEEKDALKANLSEDLSLSGHFTRDVYRTRTMKIQAEGSKYIGE